MALLLLNYFENFSRNFSFFDLSIGNTSITLIFNLSPVNFKYLNFPIIIPIINFSILNLVIFNPMINFFIFVKKFQFMLLIFF
mgnify:CR=1 FL=1